MANPGLLGRHGAPLSSAVRSPVGGLMRPDAPPAQTRPELYASRAFNQAPCLVLPKPRLPRSDRSTPYLPSESAAAGALLVL